MPLKVDDKAHLLLNASGELKKLTSQNCDDNSKRETGPKS